jgi:hypothetical protein
MAHLSLASFRKLNMDGTWNSICMRCFQTIAANQLEVEVEKIEKDHVCASSLLSQRAMRSSLSSSR